jgi:spore maturation protein B
MSIVVPLIFAFVGVFSLCRGTDVFPALTDGAKDGLKVVLAMLPPLVAILSAVSMLRASGAMEALTCLAAPLLGAVGIPPETAPLMLVRPLSGSGALAIGSEIISSFGPDSAAGRAAAVMLGSTETTFYTVAVYFGAAGIKRTRHTIPAALCADAAGFLAAAFFARIL